MPESDPFVYLPVTSADIHREVYLTSVGRLRYEPGAPYPCPGHPEEYDFRWARGRELGDFALVFIERGEGEYEDRQLGRVGWKAGALLYLPPGAWHRYRPARGVGWTESWLCANGSLLHRWRAKGLFPRTPLLRELPHAADFRNAHRDLRRRSKAGNCFPLATRALECFCIALDGVETGHRGDALAVTGSNLVDKAIEFILVNCHRPLDVPAVADALHTTRRTLERAFAEAHVRSVAEEIAWNRLERARLMLAEGNMSLKEIGYATGLGGGKRLLVTFRRFARPVPGTGRHRGRS